MPITSIDANAEALTLTVAGEYPVPVERLWDAYAAPRQLEKFWGPETWPATFTRHDMAVGGSSRYYMTGPDGSKSHGWWRFIAVEPHRRLEVEDGFAHEDGRPDEGMPTMRMVVTFESMETGSRFTSVTRFPDLEAMERLAQMGMVEGLRSALGQLDGVLRDETSFGVERATGTRILNERQVRISRVVRGSVEQVWRAHHEPELMKRWLLGPAGWTMPLCEVATAVGGAYRYEWESEDGSQRFGFEGELLESSPPHRAVTTERLLGSNGPRTTNEMTLTPVATGTLLTIVITYPDAAVRDAVLGTGMTTGMEASYARLESDVLAVAP
jgi:uncharacterized protein YndB with AHSA1/START domain